jgi:hypothetical protein
MDLHDEKWQAHEVPISADASQLLALRGMGHEGSRHPSRVAQWAFRLSNSALPNGPQPWLTCAILHVFIGSAFENLMHNPMTDSPQALEPSLVRGTAGSEVGDK